VPGLQNQADTWGLPQNEEQSAAEICSQIMDNSRTGGISETVAADMKQKFTIRNDANKKTVLLALQSLEEPHDVYITPHKRDRTAEQNAAMWLIETYIGQHVGMTKDEMHDVHKKAFLVPIFVRDDPAYAEMWAAVQNAPDGAKRALEREVVKLTSTTRCSTKQLSEFIDDLIAQANDLGVRLPAREW
jgi:hypothetical protein